MAESTLVDRVKVYVISSGEGAFTLGGPVRAFRGTEALTDGASYSYAAESGALFEVGRGQYVASLDSLIRSPLYSSNGNAPVNFPTNIELALTLLASDIVTSDELAALAAQVDAMTPIFIQPDEPSTPKAALWFATDGLGGATLYAKDAD